MSELPNKTGKKFRPLRMIFLFFVGLFIIHFGLKSVGVDTMKRSEEVSWLDRSNGPEAPISRHDLSDAERDRRVDAVLDNIAVQFAEDKRKNRTSSKRELRKKGLNSDEAEYYQDLQQREADDRGMSASDWVNTVQTSYKTYKTVQSIFDRVDGNKGEEMNNGEMNDILSDPELRDITFSDIEKTFNIARPTIEAFARRGGGALNDWATFVDQNKKRDY
ncbi:MAG: hypothetical protein AAGG68_26020 [Bacteroidota bacterium]